MEKREIKFRGFSADSNKWIYGYLNKPFDDITQIIEKIPSNASQMSLIVNGSEGQFTGLLDKNGKEIYEGDIVGFIEDYKSDSLGLVIYNIKTCGFIIEKINTTDIFKHIHIFQGKCEVIGNFFQGSDLLYNLHNK